MHQPGMITCLALLEEKLRNKTRVLRFFSETVYSKVRLYWNLKSVIDGHWIEQFVTLNKTPALKEEKGRWWVGSDALPRCPFRRERHTCCSWRSSAGRDPRLFIPVGIVSAQDILLIQYHVPFLGERDIRYEVHMWSKAWISHPLSVLFWRAILVLELHEAST